MLAFAWSPDKGRPHSNGLEHRLATSLCAGIGGFSGAVAFDDLHFAYRPLRSTPALSRSWRPAILPSGQIAVFHGYFDNAREIAAQLGSSFADLSRLYGLAVERWGDEAERRIIGEYCALVVDPRGGLVRLSRSPLRAPPLHYFHNRDLTAAASVSRALFAAGAERRLNEKRVADSALINFTDPEMSWFENVRRVPTGHVVELKRGGPDVNLRRSYDLFATPPVRMSSDAEYLARASELLDEGVKACLAGFRQPGVTLSGGLDSPQLALRTLAALPADQRLPTFTFHPEAGFDGIVEPGTTGDERPFVHAFLAMHPRLEPHFTANDGLGHDHRWNDFFHLMGGAPSGLCNMYVFHGLLSSAKTRGCDVLLLAEWGNYTFSDKGDWGFVEYFLKGRWRQLWRALRSPTLKGPMWHRFVARTASALLPDRLWRPLRRIVFPKNQFLLDLMQPLTEAYRRVSGADQRLKQAAFVFERYQPHNRRHAQKLLFRNDDCESAEIYQAFEEMYGVAIRDPMSYRPFVEFCYGLPVEMFMRDGVMRWMAKEMAKGIMPEEQRENRLNGRWDADWHLRIGRRRREFLDELDGLKSDERIAGMVDIPRLRRALEDWPEQTETDAQQYFPREFAVPRGLLTARFVKWAESRNEP
jgi:asparagine synthase (glutamine-hydrolysing)